MVEGARFSRRDTLVSVGTVGLGGLAGCNSPQRGAEPRSTGTRGGPSPETTNRHSGQTVSFAGGDSHDFAAALRELGETPGTTLEIENGEYRFSPAASGGNGTPFHFEVDGVSDGTVEGNGATIVLTDPLASGMHFEGGSGLTIRNLTFDYDPVPFTQGTITDLSSDRRRIRVELDPGYPGLDHEMFDDLPVLGGSVHTQAGEFISGVRRGDGALDKVYSNVRALDDRTYELTLWRYANSKGLETGRKLAIKARRGLLLNFYHVDRPLLENVTVRSSTSAAFNFAVCDRPVVRDCVISPPPGTNRLLSINADGVRFSNAIEAPRLENSRIEYTGDDPIVVQQTMTTVTEILDDRTISVEHLHPFVVGNGDRLRAMSQDGVRKGTLPPIDEIDFLFEGPFARRKPDTITFANSIADVLDASDLIANTATGCHGFEVRDNVVRNVRGNLTRIAASHGIVAGNVLEGSHRHGIEIECDTDDTAFVPKGGVTNVTVRNNHIVRPGLNYFAGSNPAGVRVHHRTREGVPNNGHPNRDIVIEGNEIERGAYVGVEVEHTDRVRIANNSMRDLNRLEYPYGGYGVVLDDVTTGSIVGNRLAGSRSTLKQFGLRSGSTAITTSSNRLQLDGTSVPARVVELVPVELRFDTAVTPPSGDRTLAIRCFRITLVDRNGTVLLEANVGSESSTLHFGAGVYPAESDGTESWRWFGGESRTARLQFPDAGLETATAMHLLAKPVQPDIQAEVFVDGTHTDTVHFRSNDPREYVISLARDG